MLYIFYVDKYTGMMEGSLAAFFNMFAFMMCHIKILFLFFLCLLALVSSNVLVFVLAYYCQ